MLSRIFPAYATRALLVLRTRDTRTRPLADSAHYRPASSVNPPDSCLTRPSCLPYPRADHPIRASSRGALVWHASFVRLPPRHRSGYSSPMEEFRNFLSAIVGGSRLACLRRPKSLWARMMGGSLYYAPLRTDIDLRFKTCFLPVVVRCARGLSSARADVLLFADTAPCLSHTLSPRAHRHFTICAPLVRLRAWHSANFPS